MLSKPRVAHTVYRWAEIAGIPNGVYYANAVRLGYPVKSLSTVIPKHWHDDIKKEFRP